MDTTPQPDFTAFVTWLIRAVPDDALPTLRSCAHAALIVLDEATPADLGDAALETALRRFLDLSGEPDDPPTLFDAGYDQFGRLNSDPGPYDADFDPTLTANEWTPEVEARYD